jgi:hypothetical protein
MTVKLTANSEHSAGSMSFRDSRLTITPQIRKRTEPVLNTHKSRTTMARSQLSSRSKPPAHFGFAISSMKPTVTRHCRTLLGAFIAMFLFVTKNNSSLKNSVLEDELRNVNDEYSVESSFQPSTTDNEPDDTEETRTRAIQAALRVWFEQNITSDETFHCADSKIETSPSS